VTSQSESSLNAAVWRTRQRRLRASLALLGSAPRVPKMSARTSRAGDDRCANTGKKAIWSMSRSEKRLANALWCAIFRADSQRGARLTRAAVTTFEEYGKMAKKGGAPTKSEVLTQISKDTGLSRKQVGGVFDSLGGVIKKSLRGNGLFTMPGLMKLKVVKKPATKAREGTNPFTGEKMTFKAKPASKKVRVLPLKNLKAMVN
jgi:DNA-binding protein HU-beta